MKKPHLFLLLIMSIFSSGLSAQQSLVKGAYFDNPYFNNPANAGLDDRPSFFLNYMSRFNRLEGKPVSVAFSATLPVNSRIAFAGYVFNDKSAILNNTRIGLSYSYVLPLEDDFNIRFGLSLVFAQSHLDLSKESPENWDPEFVKFNSENRFYADGDFGAVLNYRGLDAGVSILNLNQKRKSFIDNNNYYTFITSVSYSIPLPGLSDSAFVKPLVMLRGINKGKSQIDYATRLNLNSSLNATAIYHSNGSFSAGLGFNFKNNLRIQMIYNTSSPQLRGFTGGTTDLALGYTLGRRSSN